MSGGRREGAGRKKIDTPRDIRRLYRFNKIEVEAIRKAVSISGIRESELVRNAILREVQRILKKSRL